MSAGLPGNTVPSSLPPIFGHAYEGVGVDDTRHRRVSAGEEVQDVSAPGLDIRRWYEGPPGQLQPPRGHQPHRHSRWSPERPPVGPDGLAA